jgi:hypothetical protein
MRAWLTVIPGVSNCLFFAKNGPEKVFFWLSKLPLIINADLILTIIAVMFLLKNQRDRAHQGCSSRLCQNISKIGNRPAATQNEQNRRPGG